MPLARQRLLAPAMFLPVTVTALLSWFFIGSKHIKKKASRISGKLLYTYSVTYYSGSAACGNDDEDNNI
jgi:hypothetical protein